MNNWIPSSRCYYEMECTEFDYIYNEDGEAIEQVIVEYHTYCRYKNEYDQDCIGCNFDGRKFK